MKCHRLVSTVVALSTLWYVPLCIATKMETKVKRKHDLNKPDFTYWTYDQIIEFFDLVKNEEQYRDLIEVKDAIQEYPEISKNRPAHLPKCSGVDCRWLIVRLGNSKKINKYTPEMYVSGTLHGNERLGPNVVTELVRYALLNYDTDPKIKHLMDTRVIYITPTTNAKGYQANTREEDGNDANRDFPYMKEPHECMKTIAGRVVNELYREHLFQIMVTFHGGTEIIAYEWGSPNHINKESADQRPSPETPDDNCIKEVAELMQMAAGKGRADNEDFSYYTGRGYSKVDGRADDDKKAGPWWYPVGSMTDGVYFVNGGMEDWSYAGSWENEWNEKNDTGKKPINTCNPRTYGQYDTSRTEYNDQMIRSIDYLIECSDVKAPPDSEFGNQNEIKENNLKDGQITRNIRIVMRLWELLTPEIYFENLTEFRTVGCRTAKLQLVSAKVPCDDIRSQDEKDSSSVDLKKDYGMVTCSGLGMWKGVKEEEEGQPIAIGESVNYDPTKECVAVRAIFDENWAKQNHPEPLTKPESHLVRARTIKDYNAENANKRIMGNQVWYFPVPFKDTPEDEWNVFVQRDWSATEKGERTKPKAGTEKPEQKVETKKPEQKAETKEPEQKNPDVNAPPKNEAPKNIQSEDTDVKEKPLLKSDRVFYLWFAVLIGLFLCFIWRLFKGSRRYAGGEPSRRTTYDFVSEDGMELGRSSNMI